MGVNDSMCVADSEHPYLNLPPSRGKRFGRVRQDAGQ